MFLVARIDTFRGITGKEVYIELQSADALYHWQTLIFCHTRIHRTLINDDVALGNNLSDGLTGSAKGSQVRIVIFVDGRRNCHDIEVAVADFLYIRGTYESVVIDGILQQFIAHLKGCIMTLHQRINTLLVHIKTNGFKLC